MAQSNIGQGNLFLQMKNPFFLKIEIMFSTGYFSFIQHVDIVTKLLNLFYITYSGF